MIDLLTAFMIGFLGSLHCVGMCGPIALALPLDRTNLLSKFSGVITYNIGRIITYTLIGLFFGVIGREIAFFGYQQSFSIFLGIVIIIMALIPWSIDHLFSITPAVSKVISKLKSSLGKVLKRRSYSSLLSIGVLNGFLPCGLVYFAVVGATASYGMLEGALFMALFGLGTVPAMLSVAVTPDLFGLKTRNTIRRALPYFAVVVGIMFILRGMDLGIPYLSPELSQQGDEAVECAPAD